MKNQARKTLALMMAIFMIFSNIIPISAMAAETNAKNSELHTVYVSTFEQLTAAISDAPADGTEKRISITSDITLASSIELPENTNIRLVNGNEGGIRLLRNETVGVGARHFNIARGATLRIGETGNVLANDITITRPNTSLAAIRGGILVRSGGTFHLYGGVITGNRANNGGGVMVNSGSVFRMIGGKLIGNYANTIGGGTYASSTYPGGTIYLYGGIISNNNSINTTSNVNIGAAGTLSIAGEIKLPGGVYNAGTINVQPTSVLINDGAITGNGTIQNNGTIYNAPPNGTIANIVSGNPPVEKSPLEIIDIGTMAEGDGLRWSMDTTGVLTVQDGANIEITGVVSNGRRVVIAQDATVSVTINALSITNPGDNPPIYVSNGATLNLIVKGENILATDTMQLSEGIRGCDTSTINIGGMGTLTAIGGSVGIRSSSITIGGSVRVYASALGTDGEVFSIISYPHPLRVNPESTDSAKLFVNSPGSVPFITFPGMAEDFQKMTTTTGQSLHAPVTSLIANQFSLQWQWRENVDGYWADIPGANSIYYELPESLFFGVFGEYRQFRVTAIVEVTPSALNFAVNSPVITVTEQPFHGIGIYGINNPSENTHIFPQALPSYTPQAPAVFTITNTGNQPTGALEISVGAEFTVSPAAIYNIGEGSSATFTVTPNHGLASGRHTAAVSIGGANVSPQSFQVMFEVITGVSNHEELWLAILDAPMDGTPQTIFLAESFELPERTGIGILSGRNIILRSFPENSVTLSVTTYAGLFVGTGAVLTITTDIALTVNGEILNHGEIVNNGTIRNIGAIYTLPDGITTGNWIGASYLILGVNHVETFRQLDFAITNAYIPSTIYIVRDIIIPTGRNLTTTTESAIVVDLGVTLTNPESSTIVISTGAAIIVHGTFINHGTIIGNGALIRVFPGDIIEVHNATELQAILNFRHLLPPTITIRLMASFDYTDGIKIDGTTIVLCLNGFTLNVKHSETTLHVRNSGDFVLCNCCYGEFNLFSTAENLAALWVEGFSFAEVTSVSAAAINGIGVFSGEDGTVIVRGNVTVYGENSAGVAAEGGNVIVHGNVTATGRNSVGAEVGAGGVIVINGTLSGENFIMLWVHNRNTGNWYYIPIPYYCDSYTIGGSFRMFSNTCDCCQTTSSVSVTGYACTDCGEFPCECYLPYIPVITIITQPTSYTITTPGALTVLTIEVETSTPSSISFQWYYYSEYPHLEFIPIPGATGASLTISDLAPGLNYFKVIVSVDGGESVTSNLARVAVFNCLYCVDGFCNECDEYYNIDCRNCMDTGCRICNPQPVTNFILGGVTPPVARALIVDNSPQDCPYGQWVVEWYDWVYFANCGTYSALVTYDTFQPLALYALYVFIAPVEGWTFGSPRSGRDIFVLTEQNTNYIATFINDYFDGVHHDFTVVRLDIVFSPTDFVFYCLWCWDEPLGICCNECGEIYDGCVGCPVCDLYYGINCLYCMDVGCVICSACVNCGLFPCECPEVSVTFNTNGGGFIGVTGTTPSALTTTPQAFTVTSGAALGTILPTMPTTERNENNKVSVTREGYRFTGWFATPSPGALCIQWSETTIATQDTTLYARWTRIENPYTFRVGATRGTNRITSADASLLARWILAPEITLANTNFCPLAADLTGDGKVTLADLTLLIKWLAGHDVERSIAK